MHVVFNKGVIGNTLYYSQTMTFYTSGVSLQFVTEMRASQTLKRLFGSVRQMGDFVRGDLSVRCLSCPI